MPDPNPYRSPNPRSARRAKTTSAEPTVGRPSKFVRFAYGSAGLYLAALVIVMSAAFIQSRLRLEAGGLNPAEMGTLIVAGILLVLGSVFAIGAYAFMMVAGQSKAWRYFTMALMMLVVGGLVTSLIIVLQKILSL